MQFFRRFIEGLFINFVSWVLQGMVITVPIIIAASIPGILSNSILLFIIIISIIALSFAIWFFDRWYYPVLKWDIIHRHNIYTLTYVNRNSARYDRKIEAIPLRKHLEKFNGGEYIWTGSSSEPSLVESADFDFKHKEICGRVEYTVSPRMIVKAYKLLTYTISVILRDDKKTATPLNFIYVKRPTKRITLILKMPIDIPIKNVRYAARAKYGEENKKIYSVGNLKQENGYNIYTFTIRRPKMFCEYEIRWDWCE
jgi:hypothetical protein